VDESKVFGSNPTYTVIPNYDEKTHLLKGYKVKNGEKGMTKISKDLIADIPMVSKGELDQRIVKNTLNRTMDQLNRCLETERKRYPTLQGKLLAELTVGTNGKVKKVIFTENTLKNENVESCIKNILLRQSFYEIDEEAVITSPITFGSSDRK
jgi:formate dehydrogenase maturation protein FdhE